MSARHYPYTGGDPGSPYFDAVPTWLNDLLLEQTPGREMRNFRLAVRKAWLDDQAAGRQGPKELQGIAARMRYTSGVAMEVVLTCVDRWGDMAYPQTRESEERRAKQA